VAASESIDIEVSIHDTWVASIRDTSMLTVSTHPCRVDLFTVTTVVLQPTILQLRFACVDCIVPEQH
jgi:hypothetical protein